MRLRREVTQCGMQTVGGTVGNADGAANRSPEPPTEGPGAGHHSKGAKHWIEENASGLTRSTAVGEVNSLKRVEGR